MPVVVECTGVDNGWCQFTGLTLLTSALLTSPALFLLFCFVGDSMATAAQAFLPAFIGKPKIAWKLSLTLQWCSIVVACLVGLGAGIMLFTSPFLFTESSAVAASLMGIIPFFALVMFFQCSSMVTEGLLLAGTGQSTPLTSPFRAAPCAIEANAVPENVDSFVQMKLPYRYKNS